LMDPVRSVAAGGGARGAFASGGTFPGGGILRCENMEF